MTPRQKKTSGKSVYKSITDHVRTLEQDQERFSADLYAVEGQITSLTSQREENFAQLALFYLPKLEAEEVGKTVKDLQAQVRQAFQEKQAKRQKLDQLLQGSQERRNELQRQLGTLDEKLEQAATQKEQTQQTIADELAAKTDYTVLHTQARQAQSRLDQNKKRAEAFTGEAAEKLKVYESEPIFRYLVRRQFGSPAYLESGLAAKLDRWVAAVVNYRQNKVNYDFLKSMPKAIQGEIERQQAELDPLVQRIEAMEQETAERRGLPAIIRRGGGLVRDKKGVLGQLEKEEQEFQRYRQERTELDGKKDGYHREALDRLKEYFKGQNIAELKRRAGSTPHQDDDKLVEQIESIDTQIKDLKRQAKEVQQQQSDRSSQLEGLRTISRKYTSKDYESSRSYFGDKLDVDALLTGYIAGSITTEDFSGELDQHHHWKPKETHSTYDTGGYTSSYSSPRRESRDDDSFGSVFSSGGDTGGGGWSGGGDIGGGGGWSSGGDI